MHATYAQALKQCAGGGLPDCLFFARALSARGSPAAGLSFAALPTFDLLCLLQRFYMLLKPGQSEAAGAADIAACLQVTHAALGALQGRSDKDEANVADSLAGVLEGLRSAVEEVPRDNAWVAEAAAALLREA